MAQSVLPLIERAQRFPISVPVRFRSGGASEWVGGSSINISRTGILFCADRILHPGSILDMEFALEGANLYFQGSVVRSSDSTTAVKFHRHNLSHRQIS